jgi:hypothetical protein
MGRLDPGPPPAWVDALENVAHPIAAIGGITGCPTASQAVGHLLAAWADAWATNRPAVLVGLGWAESDGLNQAARTLLVRRGEVGGPSVASGSRQFQTGDRVVALRRLSHEVRGGTFLSVLDVDARRSRATVGWGGRTAILDRPALAHMGYAYAATPALAAHSAGSLMVLGPPDAMGRHQARVVAAALVAVPPSTWRTRAAERTRNQDRGLAREMG